MATIPQNNELIKNLAELLEAHRRVFGQRRVYLRVVELVLAEVMAFGRHTVTQLLMVLGQNDEDWSGWYRVFAGVGLMKRRRAGCWWKRPSST